MQRSSGNAKGLRQRKGTLTKKRGAGIEPAPLGYGNRPLSVQTVRVTRPCDGGGRQQPRRRPAGGRLQPRRVRGRRRRCWRAQACWAWAWPSGSGWARGQAWWACPACPASRPRSAFRWTRRTCPPTEPFRSCRRWSRRIHRSPGRWRPWCSSRSCTRRPCRSAQCAWRSRWRSRTWGPCPCPTSKA